MGACDVATLEGLRDLLTGQGRCLSWGQCSSYVHVTQNLVVEVQEVEMVAEAAVLVAPSSLVYHRCSAIDHPVVVVHL